MSEVVDGIRNFINERLSSPLLGTYLISWPIWNYQVLLYAFSDLGVEEKIGKIDYVLFSSSEAMQHSFGVPLLVALAYVFVLPLPSSLALGFTLGWNQLNRRIRQYIECHALMSKEEAKMILSGASKKHDELEEKVAKQAQQLDRINALLTDVEVELDAEKKSHAETRLKIDELKKNKAEIASVNFRLVAVLKYMGATASDLRETIYGLDIIRGPNGIEYNLSGSERELLLETIAKFNVRFETTVVDGIEFEDVRESA